MSNLDSVKQEVIDIVKKTYPAAVQDVVLKSYLNAPTANTIEYWQVLLDTFKQQQKEASGEIKKGTENGFRFEGENGEAAIIEYEGSDTVVNIPAEIQGCSVTTIKRIAFRRKDLTSVTIPNSVKKIEDSAFYGNQLTSVTIPDSILEIEESAFEGNQLTEVNIGKNTEIIGNQAFKDNKITNLSIPDSVKKIGESTFDNNQLENLTIGNGVSEIGRYAFSNSQLTSITIPGNVKSIGKRAFSSNKLTKVILKDGVETIDEEAFRSNEITEVVIPDSVKKIDNGAFAVNNNLLDVIIPNDAVLGDKPFGDASVTRAGGTVEAEGKMGAMFETSSAADGNSCIITKVNTGFYGKIPPVIQGKPVVGIGPKAFLGGSNNIKLEIPDSVTYIAEEAFADRQYACKFEIINLGKNVTSIGKRAFANCGLRGSVVIPSGVTKIEEETFTSNPLKELASNKAFTNAGNTLTSITLHDKITSIGNKAFFSNEIAEVIIPASVASIGKEAFAKNKIASLTLPPGVKVGEDAFIKNETCEGDFTVYYTGDGRSLIIKSYHGEGKELTLPNTLRGLLVSEIDISVFLTDRASYYIIPDNARIGGSSGMLNGSGTMFKMTMGNNVIIDSGKGQGIDNVARQTLINVSNEIIDKQSTKGYEEYLAPIGSIKDGEYIPFYDVYKNNGSKACVMKLMMDIDMNRHKTGNAKWVIE